MAKFKLVDRWPDVIDSCLKCEKDKGFISYGRRGLCIGCDRIETLAGTIKSWPKIERDKDKHSKAASQYTKDNYWRRKKAALIYRVVSSIGSIETSERLGVSKEVIVEWMNGDPIPDAIIGSVQALADKIKRLTREAHSNSREEEIFENFDVGVRFFDGKSV